MAGTSRDDTFVVDNANDRVVERGVSLDGRQQSFDTILSSVSYELPDNVEALVLTGSAATSGWGNELYNRLDGAQNASVNTLAGGAGEGFHLVEAARAGGENSGEGVSHFLQRATVDRA